MEVIITYSLWYAIHVIQNRYMILGLNQQPMVIKLSIATVNFKLRKDFFSLTVILVQCRERNKKISLCTANISCLVLAGYFQSYCLLQVGVTVQ